MQKAAPGDKAPAQQQAAAGTTSTLAHVSATASEVLPTLQMGDMYCMLMEKDSGLLTTCRVCPACCTVLIPSRLVFVQRCLICDNAMQDPVLQHPEPCQPAGASPNDVPMTGKHLNFLVNISRS